jgi:hypothetical protein
MFHQIAMLGIVSGYLGGAACGGGGEGAEPGSGQIPAPLLALEGAAEGAYDQALAGDAAGYASSARTIDAGWKAWRGEAVSDGASATALSDMDRAVAGMTGADGAVPRGRAANAVSAPMEPLFEIYGPTVPTGLLVMDYLGRELVLDGMAAEFSVATTDVDRLAKTWAALRPKVLVAGGAKEAADFDAVIESLKTDAAASSSASLIHHANAALDLTDVVEKLFGG